MSLKNFRTTFALGEATVLAIRDIAANQGVSQAQVIRSSVAAHRAQLRTSSQAPTRRLAERRETSNTLWFAR